MEKTPPLFWTTGAAWHIGQARNEETNMDRIPMYSVLAIQENGMVY